MSKRLSVMVAVIALGLGACTTLEVDRSEMAMGIDRTVGAGIRPSDRNVLLVTLTDGVHESLTQGESVSREAGLPPLYARFIAEMRRNFGIARIADWPLTSIGVRCLVFETDRELSSAFLSDIAAHRFVETAQPLGYFNTSASTGASAYNDPYYELQTGHDKVQIPASHAWATGRGVIVAVVDTGIDATHPDLKDRVAGLRNFVGRGTREFRTDIHGTAVAGVIAANANNDTGIVGVAPEARILGLKACEQGERRTATCNSFTLAKAIDFAIDQRADIINLSLAGPRDALLERLIDQATERGAIVVGARGRDENFPFPASAASTITAASEEAPEGSAAHIVAPGRQIVATVPGAEYDFFNGSSFSAAYVSGIVALVRQRKPHASASLVQELLRLTADETSGLTNACHALARIVSGDDCPPNLTSAVADRRNPTSR